MSEVYLSENVREIIDTAVLKYPADKKQSAIKSALHAVQDEHGWLSEEHMDAVADYLDMPKIAVYEVASFYTMYDLEPVGKNKINVCTNISCMLCGSDKISQYLKNKLGVEFGETTSDGKFTLTEVECLGACANAPMFQLNKDYYENLTPEKIDKILEGLE